MSEIAILLSRISRSFGDVRAVEELSMEVYRGEVFGFLGHNGAGKTTTIRLLNGVLKPDTGSIQVLEMDPGIQGTEVRARTGVLTETPSLDERLTGEENLHYHADLYSIPRDAVRERVWDMLEQFGLSERADDLVGGYSKGMKQRLALARAFLHEPEIVFLDEPTSGLDPVAAQEVRELIRHISRHEGRTVFLCTHNLVEAQRLCDRLAILEQGRVVASGTPDELAHAIQPERMYSLEVRPEDVQKAAGILKDVQGVTVVSGDVDSLEVTIQDEETVPLMLEKLLAQSIGVYAVIPNQASLEDIYMAIHRENSK